MPAERSCNVKDTHKKFNHPRAGPGQPEARHCSWHRPRRLRAVATPAPRKEKLIETLEFSCLVNRSDQLYIWGVGAARAGGLARRPAGEGTTTIYIYPGPAVCTTSSTLSLDQTSSRALNRACMRMLQRRQR